MIAILNILDLTDLDPDWSILEYDNAESPGLVAIEYSSITPLFFSQIFNTLEEFQSFKSSNIWRNE